jgi:hypothetical protein
MGSVTKDSGAEAGTSDAQGDGADVDAGTYCASYADCMNAGFMPNPQYPNVSCDVDTHTCVQLTSPECPLVIGDYTESMDVPPIFVGAFAVIPPDQTSDPSYQNYKLAIDDFTNYGGVPVGGANAKLRMPVAVVCNYLADLPTAMQDLQNAHVSSVVAAFGSDTALATTFSSYGYNTSANLFFVDPFGADSILTGLSRGNQLWHMLGDPSDLASAYVALMPLIENYVRNNAPWNLGPLVTGDGGPASQLRVAMVTGQATVLNDLSSAVQSSSISWNNGGNGSNTANGNTATFHSYAITMSSLNGDAPNASMYSTMFNSLVAALQDFQPHVIISFGSDEFLYLQALYEAAGPNTLPFYVVGPYNADSPALQAWIGVDSPPAENKLVRVVGINYASPTNSTLAAYQTHFNTVFPDDGGPNPNDNESNFYDAMYFAIDSLIGAGKPPLSGQMVGTGMLDLIAASGTPCDMGPGEAGFPCVYGALNTSTQVSLLGTLGPPTFNNMTGARKSQGDVYCLQPVPENPPGYVYDVLRLGTDGGAQVWEGTFPCYSGFQ